MRNAALAGIFLVASACWGQEPAGNTQQRGDQAQAQAPAVPQNQTITIPAGTRIPMTLASPITTKTSRPGNTVRAITAFPVTVDTQLAIPVGTYVEGVIDKLSTGGLSGPTLEMHFTRILFANGYSVTLDATNAVAQVITPGESLPEDTFFATENLPGHSPFPGEAAPSSYAAAAQQGTGLPPLHNPGPSIGAVAGIGMGAIAAGIIAHILIARHNGGLYGGPYGIVFDTGWQFQMVLQSPLTLDAASVADVIASSGT